MRYINLDHTILADCRLAPLQKIQKYTIASVVPALLGAMVIMVYGSRTIMGPSKGQP